MKIIRSAKATAKGNSVIVQKAADINHFIWSFWNFQLLRECRSVWWRCFSSEIPWDGCWVDCHSDQAVSQKNWTSLSTGVGLGRTTLCSRFVWDQTSCKVSFHFLYIFARCSIHQLVFVFLALPWHLIPVLLGFTISRVQDNFQWWSILNVILYLFTLFPELIPVTSSQSQYDVLSSSLASHVI